MGFSIAQIINKFLPVKLVDGKIINAQFARVSNPVPLNVPTYAGSSQPMHPSVVEVPSKLNGYRYWMAYTPYDTDDNENPSIVASNDLVTWTVPDGLTNPIVPAPNDVATGGYNSDPFLMYDWSTKLLHVYYRTVTASKGVTIYRKTSIDGVEWGNSDTVTFDLSGAFAPNPVDAVSPSVLKISSSRWEMYYVFGGRLYRATSSDGIAFSHPKQLINNMPASCTFWHGDFYKDSEGYHCVTSAFSVSESVTNTKLFYGFSADGLFWTFDNVALLTPTPNTFLARNVYKASLVKYGDDYRLLVSGSDFSGSAGAWAIGYVDCVRTGLQPELKESLATSFVNTETGNLVLAPGQTFSFGTMSFPKSKASLAIRLLTTMPIKVDVNYVDSKTSSTPIGTHTLVSYETPTLTKSLQFEVQNKYGFINISNPSATENIEIRFLTLTIYP